jgi:hypothetical protein
MERRKEMSLEEKVLQTAKEIIVKFIEVGRVSPTTFAENFKDVYSAVRAAVLAHRDEDTEENPGDVKKKK